MLLGITFVNRKVFRSWDALTEYGPAKTFYNRWKWWSDMADFARMMTGLAAETTYTKTILVHAIYLKADRTAPSV